MSFKEDIGVFWSRIMAKLGIMFPTLDHKHPVEVKRWYCQKKLFTFSFSLSPASLSSRPITFSTSSEHMIINQSTEYKTVCAIKFARSDFKHSYEQVSWEEYCNVLAWDTTCLLIICLFCRQETKLTVWWITFWCIWLHFRRSERDFIGELRQSLHHLLQLILFFVFDVFGI